MPSAVRCCLSVTGWHLAEPHVGAELSVVTADCLMTFVSIYRRILLNPTVTQCWQGCRKFIFFLLGAWPDMYSLWQLVFVWAVPQTFPRGCQRTTSQTCSGEGEFFPRPSLSFSFPPRWWPCVPFCYHLTFNNSLAALFWGSSSQIKASEPNPSSKTLSYLFHNCGNPGSRQIYQVMCQLLGSSHVNLKIWSFCNAPLSQVRPRQLAVSAQTNKERD